MIRTCAFFYPVHFESAFKCTSFTYLFFNIIIHLNTRQLPTRLRLRTTCQRYRLHHGAYLQEIKETVDIYDDSMFRGLVDSSMKLILYYMFI